MYYRITKTKWDQSKKEEVYAIMDSLREKMEILNARSITEFEFAEGESFIIAVYDSKETADKAQPHAQELLGGFAEYMTAPPEPYEGEVTWEL